MTTKSLFLITCVIMGFICCSGQNPNDCRDQYLEYLHRSLEYRILRTSFHDSLSNWMNRSLPGLKTYQDGEFDWKLDDIVLFSSDSTRAILFMSKVRKLPDRVDQIKAFTGMKIEGKWWFIFSHHVNFMVPRKSMEKRHTFEELSQFILPRFYEDGLVVSSNCQIYYPTIETDTWFKSSRLEEHKRKFLKMKY